jgi:hypothetical protein
MRNFAAAAAGLVIGQVLVVAGLQPALRESAAFATAMTSNPAVALAVTDELRWGIRLVTPLVFVGILNFLELRGLLRRPSRSVGELPPFPADPTATQLTFGEAHEQDGRRSAQPCWIVQPEAGMCAGTLITGATGAGKTHAILNPLLRQLIRLHAHDAKRRPGGLIIDPKGNMGPDVLRECREAGREEDFYHLSMPSARYNVIGRPDLGAPMLAGHISDVLANVQGHSHADPFWATAARELATQTLRVIRLAEGRIPAMDDLYRCSASEQAYAQTLEKARGRRAQFSPQELEELESLEYWHRYTLEPMDGRTRANISANLSGLCSLFDEPSVRRCFCPRPSEETFPGFDRLITEGRIVVLSLPKAKLKWVAVMVSCMTKLNFQDAVLQRLANAQGANADVGRLVFMLADEADMLITQPGDGEFLSKCREARCATIFAVQSYTSIGRVVRDEASKEQLIAQLRTKVWLTLEDNPTSKSAADLCGKVDRLKRSETISENAQSAPFSFLDRQRITEGNSSASASTNWSLREEYVFPPWVFTSLRTFQAVMRVFDGSRVLPAWVVYTKPLHLDPNVSWFESEPGGALQTGEPSHRMCDFPRTVFRLLRGAADVFRRSPSATPVDASVAHGTED